MALEQDYDIIARLGEGAFGKVYKAQHKASGDIVAVKQIKLGSKSWDEALKSTELAALRALRHNFIVRLRELLRSPKDGSLYYVFEFIGSDLFRLMRQNPQGLEENHAAELQRQIYSGLSHTHQNSFFHRDVKPENILYDDVTDTVRLADFGEARSLRARPPFTDYVGTRWYRAPECLLRDRSYSSPVDVWAAGLVFCELLRGSAVFCGTSSMDQLYKIFTVLGHPTTTDWPELSRLAEACRFRVPDQRGCGLDRVLPRASPQAVAFATEVLRLNPRRRPLARKCLEHSFFLKFPALDLGRAEVFRCGRTPSSVDIGDEPLGSVRSQAPYSAQPSARYCPDAAGGSRPPTPPQDERNEEPPMRQPSGALSLDHDDLDLDAELDKILSPSSPKQRPLAATTASAAARVPAVRPPPSLPAAPVPAAAPRPAALDAPASVPRRHTPAAGGPPSPTGCSVDALFEHLCADLGFEPSATAAAVEQPGPAKARLESTMLPNGPVTLAVSSSALPPSGYTGQAVGLARNGGGGRLRPSGRSLEDSGPEDAVLEDRGFEDAGLLPSRRTMESSLSVDSSVDSKFVLPRGKSWETGPSGTVDPWSLSNMGLTGIEKMVAGADPPSRAEMPLAHSTLLPPSTPHGTFGDTGTSWLSQAASRRPASAALAGRSGSTGRLLNSPQQVRDALTSASPAPSGDEDWASALRKPVASPPWTADDSTQLRRVVKRLVKRGNLEKEALWLEVSRELGGGRAPAECKKQYARDYKAHKAASGGVGS